METGRTENWPLKRITQNQVTGSRGEAFISFLLSKYCLVRPVANGTDVGVDLYCEVLKDGIPHIHFWVQVKSSTTRRRQVYLKKSDLEYWSRQPIPVFIFFVKVEDGLTSDKFCVDVVNLTAQFIREPFVDPSGPKCIPLQKERTLSNLSHIADFVYNVVPVASSRIFVRDGFIFQAKRTVHESYIKEYHEAGIRKFSRQFLKNIGRTAALLLNDICSAFDWDQFPKERERLEKVLEAFEDYGNYDFHFAVGSSKHLSGDGESAIAAYERALNCLKSDKNIPDEDVAPLVARIEHRIKHLQRKQSIIQDAAPVPPVSENAAPKAEDPPDRSRP